MAFYMIYKRKPESIKLWLQKNWCCNPKMHEVGKVACAMA